MADRKKMAFHHSVLKIPVESLLPLRVIRPAERLKLKYHRIESSMKEIGVIEPLIVFPQNGMGGPFLILDGTLRFDILKEWGLKEIPCIVATQDETYTYNSKVSEVTSIQEHYMIAKAIERGVSKKRIADTLNVKVETITSTEKLLDGLCPEAIELLKNTAAKHGAIRILSKVVPVRQIEMVELMTIANNFSIAYAKSLFAGTPENQLKEPEKGKELKGLKAEDIAMMEKEMQDLGKRIGSIDETYSLNALNLVLATGYLKKLLENNVVVRFLSQYYNDILDMFTSIAEATSLDQ